MHRWLIALLAVVFSLVACDDRPSPEDDGQPPTTETVAWSEAYALLDTITPDQSDGHFIVTVSGIDFTPHHMALADFSEATVKLFRRPEFTLARTMGGKGDGPGEFAAPFSPQFDAQGRLHVADYGRNRITVFDSAGLVLRTVQLPMFHGIIDFDVLQDGTYLMSAGIVGDSLNSLFHLDSAGNEINRFMPSRRALPAGEGHNQVWDRVRHTNAAPIGGESVITSVSILDSLWTLDLRTGRMRGVQVGPPGYEPPTLTEPGRVRSWDEGNAWIDSLTAIPTLFSSGNTVYAPFAKPIYIRSETSSVVVGGPGQGWKSLTDAPVILGVEGDTVITILPDSITFVVRFARFVPRGTLEP